MKDTWEFWKTQRGYGRYHWEFQLSKLGLFLYLYKVDYSSESLQVCDVTIRWELSHGGCWSVRSWNQRWSGEHGCIPGAGLGSMACRVGGERASTMLDWDIAKRQAMELVLTIPTYHFEKKKSSPGQKMTIDL